MKQHTSASSRNSGFTLIELIVYFAILITVMAMVVRSFIPVLRNTVQQSNIAETKIETTLGMELLRTDLEHAGFGLPWQFPSVPSPYDEPLAAVAPSALNDAPNVPRALASEDGSVFSMHGADYLVVRASNIAMNDVGQKFGYVGRNAAHQIAVQPLTNNPAFINTDRVIVIQPEISPVAYRGMIMSGANYVTLPTTTAMAGYAPDGTPNDPDGIKYLVYGINDDNVTRAPFNRADYYISDGTTFPTATVPSQCAPNTGVLVKAVMHHNPPLNLGDDYTPAGEDFSIMPILDCVADFQVVYYLDTNTDGGWDTRVDANGLNGLSPEQVREQVKLVRLYVLSHEGGLDRLYTFATPTINVGELAADGTTLLAGRTFNLSTNIINNWANYRWKVYSMAVNPKNLN